MIDCRTRFGCKEGGICDRVHLWSLMENKNKRPRFIQMEKNDIDSMMTDNNNNNQLPDSNNNSNNSKQQKSSSSKIVSTWEEFFEDPINTELHSELINNFIDVCIIYS